MIRGRLYASLFTMLAFVIFAVTFVVVLLVALIYLYPGSSKPSTIPGLEPTTKEDGNLADISRAGSLHEFLLDLHKQYGSIASFWMGTKYVVSIASPELFKEHQGVFDRPPELFKLFEPLIGPNSIQYANKADGRNRRHHYDKALSYDAIKYYYQDFQEVANDLVKKWSTMVKEEHVPLGVNMGAFALKVDLLTLFGKNVTNDKEILDFERNYAICWSEMERRLTDIPDANSPRQKSFDEALTKLKSYIRKIVKTRKDNPPVQGRELIIDILIETCPNEDTLISDAISFVVGGFHTTSNSLTWCIYFLATHTDVQDKVYKEIQDVLGKDEVDHNNLGSLKYIRQVFDETLRCGVIAPWAARFQDHDTQLGGHFIPKNTPVIHALGVSLQDEKYWPLPNKFDPDRFSPENTAKRPTMAFQAFGFAGKRICPGYRFAYAEGIVCLVTVIRQFKISLVEGQVVNPVHGLVTHPEEEIWIKLSKR